MSAKKQPKKALGRGLSALLGDAAMVGRSTQSGFIQPIDIEKIQINPFQPRKDFDEVALKELADSVKVHGVIQPITVKQLDGGEYQLIAGERRFRASKLAGLKKIPAYIRMADDQQMLEMALIENIQRRDLNPIEIALSYQGLLAECKLTQEQLGERVGKDRTTVNNYLRLLKLPPDIQIALRDDKISMGHARALIAIPKVHTQLSILHRILEEGLSVRRVESIVRNLLSPKEKGNQQKSPHDLLLKDIKKQLAHQLGTKVAIKVKDENQGEIKISFSSEEDLQRIIAILSPEK